MSSKAQAMRLNSEIFWSVDAPEPRWDHSFRASEEIQISQDYEVITPPLQKTENKRSDMGKGRKETLKNANYTLSA
jgi:hypothetical protein